MARERLGGQRFYKMTGSGNDFVVLNAMETPLATLPDAELVAQLCDRRNGIGADGVVVLDRSATAAARMIYFNRDGTRGEMCGNAALCSTRLVSELGHMMAGTETFTLETDSGFLTVGIGANRAGRDARASSVTTPWIELPIPEELDDDVPLVPLPGETRFGFARVGVPHLVVLCEAGHEPVVEERGRALRHDGQFAHGANVNFVMPRRGKPWRIRTFERGVEAETLACGTGTGASALLLACWGLESTGVAIPFETTSGKALSVELPDGPLPSGRPRLRGEGRLVFSGELRELA